MSTDYDFIKVGEPVCPKYGSGPPAGKHYERTVEYITEILGDLIITRGGSYKKEDLESVKTVYERCQEGDKWAEDLLKGLKNKGKDKE
jgi:hypothetical protein